MCNKNLFCAGMTIAGAFSAYICNETRKLLRIFKTDFFIIYLTESIFTCLHMKKAFGLKYQKYGK